MTMKHDYAREKLTLLLRDLDSYNGDEFWRQMSRIANGATHHPSAEALQETVTLVVTCLNELYEALGVGGVNETFQQHEALKAIGELSATSEECQAVAAHMHRIIGLCRDADECEQESEEMGIAWDKLEGALQDSPATSLHLHNTHQQIKALSDAAEAIVKEFQATDTLTANQVYQRLVDQGRELRRAIEQDELP